MDSTYQPFLYISIHDRFDQDYVPYNAFKVDSDAEQHNI